MTPIDRINHVLWTVWDPIGSGVPKDEYADYAEVLFGLFTVGNNSIDSGVDYLMYVQKFLMGLPVLDTPTYAVLRASLAEQYECTVVWITCDTTLPDTVGLRHRTHYSYRVTNGVAEIVVYSYPDDDVVSPEDSARSALSISDFAVNRLKNPTFELKTFDWWPDQWKAGNHG